MSSVDQEPSLWAAAPTVPEGFIYRPDFLAVDEEQQLIRHIEELALEPFQYYQFTGKRRTVGFGWQYEFGQKDIRPAPEIPQFLLPVRTRVGALFGIDPNDLAQASVIEYPVGAPIGWHRDIPHFGSVIGISLGEACRMRFRKYLRSRVKPARDEILSIDLQPRSIYLMGGASRDGWQHSIPPVKELRYAIMLRTLRNGRNRQRVTP